MKPLLIIICACNLVTAGFGQQLSAVSPELFLDEAGRPEFSPDGKQVAFHARSDDKYYDIFISDTDGSNKVCLTCNHPDLPNKHIGQPSWHPNGEWIIFQAEKKDHVMKNIHALAAPGIGYHNDIYVMQLRTKKVFRLSNLNTKSHIGDPTPACGILQPHFSSDGSLVSWSQRVDDGGEWGKWEIRIADFVVEGGTPDLIKITMYTPGVNQGYYESNDFLNDTMLIICGNLEPNQTELGLDIYTLHIRTKDTTRLTHSLNYFDECPHPSHDGNKVCYLSTEGFEIKSNKRWWSWAKGEFWLMDPNGGNKQQITHFNTPGYPEYNGNRVIPAYITWSPDDKTILLGIAVEYKKHKLKDQIWRLQLK